MQRYAIPAKSSLEQNRAEALEETRLKDKYQDVYEVVACLMRQEGLRGLTVGTVATLHRRLRAGAEPEDAQEQWMARHLERFLGAEESGIGERLRDRKA